jgi:hypothetical protein
VGARGACGTGIGGAAGRGRRRASVLAAAAPAPATRAPAPPSAPLSAPSPAPPPAPAAPTRAELLSGWTSFAGPLSSTLTKLGQRAAGGLTAAEAAAALGYEDVNASGSFRLAENTGRGGGRADDTAGGAGCSVENTDGGGDGRADNTGGGPGRSRGRGRASGRVAVSYAPHERLACGVRYSSLQAFRTADGKGWGVRGSCPIAKGTVVVEVRHSGAKERAPDPEISPYSPAHTRIYCTSPRRKGWGVRGSCPIVKETVVVVVSEAEGREIKGFEPPHQVPHPAPAHTAFRREGVGRSRFVPDCKGDRRCGGEAWQDTPGTPRHARLLPPPAHINLLQLPPPFHSYRCEQACTSLPLQYNLRSRAGC